MIRSMTAFAKSSYEGKEFTLDVFIRTYNHRYLDINLKLPIELLHLEGDLRALTSKHLSRGRVEMTVKATILKEGIYSVFINKALVDQLVEETKDIQKRHGDLSEVEIASLLRIPGMVEIQTDVQKINPETLQDIKEIVETSLTSLVEMRKQEGKILAQDIQDRLDSLESLVQTVEAESKNYPNEVRARLERNLKEIWESCGMDSSRFLQEIAYYSERSDVTEELVRIRSHILQCRSLLQKTEAIGRKLDFLLQEFLREINTIGSKCNLLTVSQAVIEMKTEVEKIREQVQNVE